MDKARFRYGFKIRLNGYIKTDILTSRYFIKWEQAQMGGICMEAPHGMDLSQMKNVDIRTVDRETLADITEVHIDGKLPRRERLADFIRQIKNPYCYRCGRAVVKISFADTDATLEDRLEHYLKTL